MAQKTVVLLQDDLDGSEAAETITFSLDGVSYEMDLSEANAAELRERFAPYVAAGRRVGGRPQRARRTGGAPARADREQLAAIRAWARSRGMDVNERGRIPRHIVEQYNSGTTAVAAPVPEPEPEPEPQSEPHSAPRRRARRA